VLQKVRLPLVGALILVAAVLVPTLLSQYYVGLVTIGLVYGLFAFGLDVVWGRAGIVNIGHAVFFGIGAYGVAIADARGIPPLAGAGLGILVALVLAVLIGLSGFRRRATASTMAVLTLGITLLAAQIATTWTGFTGGPNGLLVLTSIGTTAYFWLCFGICAAIVLACQALIFSRGPGNRIVATRINPVRASHLGIDVQRQRLLALSLGACISAVAGALDAPLAGLVTPDLVGVVLSTQVLIWVAIGGRNTLLGPFLGAMAATVVQDQLSGISPSAYLLILGALFIFVVVVAPDGLLGHLRRRHEIVEPWRLRARRGAARAELGAPTGGALVVRELVKQFGVTRAVDGVSLEVAAGEIVCLIGPNGAGKTTLLNVVSGDLVQDGGSVAIFGRELGSISPHRRSRLALGRTFQVPSLFAGLTVGEHLDLARFEAGGEFHLPAAYERFRQELAHLRVEQLSLGDRRSLEIALALSRNPRLLLLDEPAAGLARDEARSLAGTLRDVRDRAGCAMVAVEHDMEIVRLLADRVLVLHRGMVLFHGSMDEVSSNSDVRDAYLGGT
jgi:branched-chain amino acid transport system permease protein